MALTGQVTKEQALLYAEAPKKGFLKCDRCSLISEKSTHLKEAEVCFRAPECMGRMYGYNSSVWSSRWKELALMFLPDATYSDRAPGYWQKWSVDFLRRYRDKVRKGIIPMSQFVKDHPGKTLTALDRYLDKQVAPEDRRKYSQARREGYQEGQESFSLYKINPRDDT